jgi:hypothetical protein
MPTCWQSTSVQEWVLQACVAVPLQATCIVLRWHIATLSQGRWICMPFYGGAAAACACTCAAVS